jgi:hypothetical protein
MRENINMAVHGECNLFTSSQMPLWIRLTFTLYQKVGQVL